MVHEHMIGQGQSRTVYAHPIMPLRVIKIARNSKGKQDNTLEWNYYHAASDDQKLWLARPIELSECGAILQMELIRHLYRIEQYPKMLPLMLRDRKPANFGMTRDGRFVSCDYALLRLEYTPDIVTPVEWNPNRIPTRPSHPVQS